MIPQRSHFEHYLQLLRNHYTPRQWALNCRLYGQSGRPTVDDYDFHSPNNRLDYPRVTWLWGGWTYRVLQEPQPGRVEMRGFRRRPLVKQWWLEFRWSHTWARRLWARRPWERSSTLDIIRERKEFYEYWNRPYVNPTDEEFKELLPSTRWLWIANIYTTFMMRFGTPGPYSRRGGPRRIYSTWGRWGKFSGWYDLWKHHILAAIPLYYVRDFKSVGKFLRRFYGEREWFMITLRSGGFYGSELTWHDNTYVFKYYGVTYTFTQDHDTSSVPGISEMSVDQIATSGVRPRYHHLEWSVRDESRQEDTVWNAMNRGGRDCGILTYWGLWRELRRSRRR